MADLTSSAPALLAVAAEAEKTVRSPLLYAWWALNLVVLVAVVYGAYWGVKKYRSGRAPRR
ncbi:hypothetical protein [Kitasatospora sp. NPDC057500]|uniref:hypothetical protein n=1 Tax=unclassified Kitasatospora TaxID=2633591 RepID=UPI0036B36142